MLYDIANVVGYVIRVRVIYYVRNFDFVGLKLKWHGALCFLCFHLYFYRFCIGGGCVRPRRGGLWDFTSDLL